MLRGDKTMPGAFCLGDSRYGFESVRDTGFRLLMK